MPTYLNNKPLTFGNLEQITRLDELEKIKKLIVAKTPLLHKIKGEVNKVDNSNLKLDYIYIENIDVNNMEGFDGDYNTVSHKLRVLEEFYENCTD